MSAHSCVIAPHLKGSIATVAEGKYGRMFPDLPGLEVGEEFLLALGRSGSVMDAASSSDESEGHTDNPRIPAAFAFAHRDLIRGRALALLSGEAVSGAMALEPLSRDELGLNTLGWYGETPLWFYILKEAEVKASGERLGDVGGRIVAEVLLGLVDGDSTSYRAAETEWRPTLPNAAAESPCA
jgi:hypothetical protein